MAQALLTRKPYLQAVGSGPLPNGTTTQDGQARHEPGAFCVDANLRSWASSRILSRGVDYYRKGRVLSLESYEDARFPEIEGKRITAEVEGTLRGDRQGPIEE